MIQIEKDLLVQLYSEENKTIREIAKLLNVSSSTVRLRLHEYNIEVKPIGNYKNKVYNLVSPFKQYIKDDNKLKELYNSYIPISKIAKELGVGDKAVIRRVKELGLQRNFGKMMSRDLYDASHDEEIVRLYKEGKSSTELAKLFNLTHNAILNHLKRCGVKRRTLSESQFNYNSKDFPDELKSYESLYDLYIVNKLSKKDLSDMLNVSTHVIDRCLKEFNIPVRGGSEAKKGLFTGKDAGNYKDGRTPLYMRLRMYFRLWQIKETIKRDGHRCQLCGSKKRLHVHHIIPFKQIFEEILSEHPDLDPVDNADELYKIATHDERMNSIDNLITYCKECHLFKIHGYKKFNKEN